MDGGGAGGGLIVIATSCPGLLKLSRFSGNRSRSPELPKGMYLYIYVQVDCIQVYIYKAPNVTVKLVSKKTVPCW